MNFLFVRMPEWGLGRGSGPVLDRGGAGNRTSGRPGQPQLFAGVLAFRGKMAQQGGFSRSKYLPAWAVGQRSGASLGASCRNAPVRRVADLVGVIRVAVSCR